MLMNHSSRVCYNNNSSQWKEEGRVKGGLTPGSVYGETAQELAPGEVTDNGNYTRYRGNQGSGSDSTSRPLMTLPSHNSQVQLPKWEVTPGLLGIYNHGNTCFMNTILQCLSNSDLVSEYFVTKKFKEILNVKGIAKRLVSAPKGEVTEQLGNLLECIWSGEYTPEISSHFKNVVSKYNSQYKGTSQHDAQEFLLWLLDRTNDELSPKKKNKDTLVKSKYKEKNDGPSENIPEASQALCSGYEVYNMFQASYQSSLMCPNCGKQSNTYESYLCLSLPVPQKSLRPVYMTVVYLDDNPKQLKIALEMNVLDTIKELREKLAYELEVPPKRLILCQVYEYGFGNTYGDDQLLSDIHESETIYIFETHPLSEINQPPSSYELIQILLVHVEKCAATKSMERFCTPELMRIPRDIDFLMLQKYILKSMRLAVSEEVIDTKFDRAIFDIRVIDSGASDCYLATDVDMPLYTQAIDRALSTYSDEFGPAHVKFVIEWDPVMKKSLVDNDEDIMEEHQSVHKVRLSQQQPTSVSLKDCLKLFTKEEKLDAGDAWNCPHCPTSHSQGTVKKLGLLSAPDILVIHLKRFRHSGLRRNKLNVLVNFPITDLDMGEHLVPQNSGHHNNQQLSDLYDLYGVSNHYGNMNGGHYTAFCKNPIDQNWYEYDDTTVNPLPVREIVSKSAYLLFYQRKKLTNNTISSLEANTHWIFNVYGPPMPAGLQYNHRSFEQDSVTNQDRNFSENAAPASRIHVRAKSEPYVKNAGMIEGDVGSPRKDKASAVMEINSPRQSNKSDSAGKMSVILDRQYSREPSQRYGDRNKLSVADQIVKSKMAADQMDGRGSGHRQAESIYDGYRRTDSIDSHKLSLISSSDIGQGTSNPPSPLSDNPDFIIVNGNVSKSDGKTQQNNVLNNARDYSGSLGSGISGTKLKIHSNHIHSPDHSKEKGFKIDSKQSGYMTSKPPSRTNQKLTNVQHSLDEGVQGSQKEMFSTPQQTRKSPSHTATNGVFSTPQPHRKSYSDSRPSMDRQSSVPIRSSRPHSSYDDPRIQLDSYGLLDDQPRSLPADNKSVLSKPPLPKQSLSRSAFNQSKKFSEDKSGRPSSAHMSNNSRVPDMRNVAEFDSRYINGNGNHSARDARDSGRFNGVDVHRTPPQVRPRNKSADRNYEERRSLRMKSERPISFHQSSHHNDYHDQYYLSQPTDTGSFDRTSYYATMRPTRGNHDNMVGEGYLEEEDMQYMARQLADHQYTTDLNAIHQPRSRAPYNPNRYSEGTERYQPHLHAAKHLSHLAKQEKLLLQQKMKSQYLKESSV